MRKPIAFVTTVLLLGSFALGQADPPPSDAKQQRVGDLPQVKLGQRSRQLQFAARVIRDVVIVPDAISYVRAIEAWSAYGRAPVLIDDGTRLGRERIARFVRAFEPRSVVRWSADESDTKITHQRIEDAIGRAWAVASAKELRQQRQLAKASARQQDRVFVPFGVVVMSLEDDAWTAGLALAAGRNQLVCWDKAGRDASGVLQWKQAHDLADRIRSFVDASGYSFESTGDEIDAVTLCLNLPGKVRVPKEDERGMLATTDLIGRTFEQPVEEGAPAMDTRWAWCGQVFGDQSAAAYRAMCALFLEPSSAWLFDGYPDKKGWNAFDMTAASDVLTKSNFDVLLNDGAERSSDDWRHRASGTSPGSTSTGLGIDAGLILVNSKGMRSEFNLGPGRCVSGDVPVLHRPSMVHFVHSWSANRQADRATVCGRWMERGVYAYIGSVHEPYLGGFVASPTFAARLMVGFPWGAAGRHIGGPVWKIGVIGDPLMTVGVPAQPSDRSVLYVEDGPKTDLAALVRPALDAGSFGEAAELLLMLGRDEDVSTLAKGLYDKAPEQLTPRVAHATIGAAARTGQRDLVVALGRMLSDKRDLLPDEQDVVWHALWPTIGTLTDGELDLLRANIRDDQMVEDIAAVHRSLRAMYGRDAAAAFAEAQREGLDEKQRGALDRALRRQ